MSSRWVALTAASGTLLSGLQKDRFLSPKRARSFFVADTPVPPNLSNNDSRRAESLPRLTFTADYLRCVRPNQIFIEQMVSQIEFIDDDFE